jgi:trehalose synthase-fused probable maltokinase
VSAVDAQAVMAKAGVPGLTCERLGEWMLGQRWFGSKARELSQVAVLDAIALTKEQDPLLMLIVEIRSPAGTHDLYQVPVGVARAGGPREAICEQDGVALYDALADEHMTALLGGLLASEATIGEGESVVSFRLGDGVELARRPQARRVGGEQSNSSVVLDDRYILKAFRRIEAGINPELEMLTFLGAHGFEAIAGVEGSYAYHGELLDASLGVMQRFIAGARDGWQLATEALEREAGEELYAPLAELGEVTGRMHSTLASAPEDPEFAPEEPADEHVALLTATIDEQIERLFVEMPDRPELAPIAGRGEELRDRLALLSHTGIGGRLLRSHGDYHLGQALLGPAGWVIIDFEGEPGRPLRERRRKRSPLRDVAGMLRSISYAALAGEVLRDDPPELEWERQSRERFLAGYMAEIDPALLPAGSQAISKQLGMFELEKLLYELRYELENRPQWLAVPVAGIQRLLDEEP